MKKQKITLSLILIVITLSVIATSQAANKSILIFSNKDKITREYIYEDFKGYHLKAEDFEDENICQTIYVVIQKGIDSDQGEYIKNVTIKDRTLTIVLFLPRENAKPLTEGMYAQSRVSSITDVILHYDDLDNRWDRMALVIEDNIGKATFEKLDIRKNEYGGRFIDEEEIVRQIPD